METDIVEDPSAPSPRHPFSTQAMAFQRPRSAQGIAFPRPHLYGAQESPSPHDLHGAQEISFPYHLHRAQGIGRRPLPQGALSQGPAYLPQQTLDSRTEVFDPRVMYEEVHDGASEDGWGMESGPQERSYAYRSHGGHMLPRPSQDFQMRAIPLDPHRANHQPAMAVVVGQRIVHSQPRQMVIRQESPMYSRRLSNSDAYFPPAGMYGGY